PEELRLPEGTHVPEPSITSRMSPPSRQLDASDLARRTVYDRRARSRRDHDWPSPQVDFASLRYIRTVDDGSPKLSAGQLREPGLHVAFVTKCEHFAVPQL